MICGFFVFLGRIVMALIWLTMALIMIPVAFVLMLLGL